MGNLLVVCLLFILFVQDDKNKGKPNSFSKTSEYGAEDDDDDEEEDEFIESDDEYSGATKKKKGKGRGKGPLINSISRGRGRGAMNIINTTIPPGMTQKLSHQIGSVNRIPLPQQQQIPQNLYGLPQNNPALQSMLMAQKIPTNPMNQMASQVNWRAYSMPPSQMTPQMQQQLHQQQLMQHQHQQQQLMQQHLLKHKLQQQQQQQQDIQRQKQETVQRMKMLQQQQQQRDQYRQQQQHQDHLSSLDLDSPDDPLNNIPGMPRNFYGPTDTSTNPNFPPFKLPVPMGSQQQQSQQQQTSQMQSQASMGNPYGPPQNLSVPSLLSSSSSSGTMYTSLSGSPSNQFQSSTQQSPYPSYLGTASSAQSSSAHTNQTGGSPSQSPHLGQSPYGSSNTNPSRSSSFDAFLKYVQCHI